MHHTIALPKLGDSVDEVIVIEVLVGVGDQVAKDQPVLRVETDKVEVDVPSPVAGTVTAVHVDTDDEVRTGEPIIDLEN